MSPHLPPEALVTGPRVYIRHPAPEDEAAFLALNAASAAHHAGWVSPALTPEDYARKLERCRAENFEGLLVFRRQDDTVMGEINLSQIVRGVFLSAYLDYQVGAPFARQGYMTEALHLALRHAFTTLGLHRLEANIQPENASSIALVRRVGFAKEGFSRRYLKIGGRWRDHERWAILREDWEGMRKPRLAPTRKGAA
jgi:[ribosomal protein S5]-alanine N-acetyltransferase